MKSIAQSIAKSTGVQLGSNQNQIPTADLVQRLFKKDQPVSQSLGTKAIDYSAVPVNADIWQSCLYPPAGTFITFSTANKITVDWTTDGVKFEAIASIKTGSSRSYVAYYSGSPRGIAIDTTGMIVSAYKNDRVTHTDLIFSNIKTTANDSFSRYRVRRLGVNLICEKTAVSDVNFAAVQYTQTINISANEFTQDLYLGAYLTGALAYIDIVGNKFAFSEGGNSKRAYSFTTSKYFDVSTSAWLGVMQNAYCHNALYGYSRVLAVQGDSTIFLNIPYGTDGLPTTSLRTDLTIKDTEEFPASKSFGLGYAIKLNASMEAYDQANTFFDASHVAKLIYKNTIPSKLNSRLFFDHKNDNELLIYSSDKSLIRPINTANKKCLVVGDSMAAESYWWSGYLTLLSGLNITTNSNSGKTLATDIQSILATAVSGTPALISDKDYIIIEGGFNDWAQNLSESTFTSGFTAIFNYIRSQNTTAKIFVCLPYNWGNPIDAGTTANTVGMTRNSMRSIMQTVANSDSNSAVINWNDANIIQGEIADNLHISSQAAAYRIAKVMYAKMLTVY